MTKTPGNSIDARVIKVLSSLGVDYEQNKVFAGRSFDFFVPSRHLFIDVDGPAFKKRPGKPVNDEIQEKMEHPTEGRQPSDRRFAANKRQNVESEGYQYLRIEWGEDIEKSIRASLE